MQPPPNTVFRLFQIGHYQQLLKKAETIEHKSHCRKELARLSLPPYHTKNENHDLVTNHSHSAGSNVRHYSLGSL